MTALTVPHIPRSVGEDSPARPPYSPTDLVGETYLGLWRAGVIPPGPMRDPQAAARACADLLRAFGVEPAEARSEVAA